MREGRPDISIPMNPCEHGGGAVPQEVGDLVPFADVVSVLEEEDGVFNVKVAFATAVLAIAVYGLCNPDTRDLATAAIVGTTVGLSVFYTLLKVANEFDDPGE